MFAELFKPAIEAAGFVASRGDAIVHVGDLGTNVWRAISQAGLIIADVTVKNPNVYYEMGLADALGKPVFLFKQAGKTLPADISGVHYYEYNSADLASNRRTLIKALKKWANEREHQFFGVKALADQSPDKTA